MVAPLDKRLDEPCKSVARNVDLRQMMRTWSEASKELSRSKRVGDQSLCSNRDRSISGLFQVNLNYSYTFDEPPARQKGSMH